MNEEEIPATIKEAIRHNALILFIGSGYSRNIALPTWIELTQIFTNQLCERDPSLLDLQTEAHQAGANPLNILTALFKRGHKDDCKSLLKDAIDIDISKHNLQNQKNIWNLSRKVITTNYDRALEAAMNTDLKEEVEVYTHTEDLPGLSLSELRDLSYLFKIHGCITRPEGCILFPEDYDKLYKYNHRFLEQLKGLCANATLLFIGYSVADIEIQQILKNIHTIFHTGTRHFILTTDKKAFENFGIETIVLENYSQLVPYIERLIAYRDKVDNDLGDLAGKVSLASDIDQEKEGYLDTEDKKDILQLEAFDSVDRPTNQKKVAALIETGHEEPLRTFLLFKRKARRQSTWAYFRQLEGRDDKTRLELALKEYMAALDIARELLEEDDFEIVNLYNEIGSCHLQQEDLPEAESYYQRALDITLSKAHPQQRRYAGIVYNNLGNLEEMKGNAIKSLEYHQTALAAAKDSAEIPSGQMRSVATQLLKLKRFAEATALFEQIIRDVKAPGLIRAYDYQALGLACFRTNKYREAITCYQQAIALFFEYYGEENEKFLRFYNDIGKCYGLCQEYDNAILYYEKAIALETNDENIFIAMNNIGEAHYNSGNFKMAKERFEKSLAFLRSKVSAREHPNGYAYCYQKIKQATDHLPDET